MDRRLLVAYVFISTISGSFQTPHLNASSTIDIPINSSLQLLCWGQYPLGWHYPQIKVNKSLPFIEDNKDISKYTSELTIDKVELDDRGEYTCYYINSSYKESESFASVKVFVNDPEHLILPSNSLYLSWCPDQPLTVPCMPVNSMVNITLWINGQGNKSMIEVNSIMNFNPFEGFSVPINFSVTSIDCIGQLNNRISEPLTFAVHSNVPAAIPQMSVTSDPDHYALINDTIVLTCSVNTDDFVYQPEWHNVKNGTQQRSITEVLVGDSNITTVLSIYNVEKVDENCYLCEIRTPCNKVTEEICIAVYDSKPLPSFNLSTHVDKPMLMKVGEKLILVAYINIVPLDSINDIDFFWYKDGRRLEEFEEHFNITLNLPKKATLRISSLNFSDTGTYMFSGNTTDESKNISIVVLVEGEPQIIISGKTSQKFYMAGTRNVFLCDVKGKPLPNITWNWKACSSYDLCDINSTVVQSALTLPNLDRVMLGDISEFQRISRLEVRAHQTGFYSCVAENEYGNNEETFLFLVTDAENGFQVKMSVMKPVELDNVTIECKASLYEYEDIRWELFPLSSKNSSIFTLDGNYSDMDVISSATSYSHQLTITFHPIYNDNSGTYVCYAEPSNNTFSTANRSVSFVVRDIWKPVIVSTNLNGSKIMIKPNQEQEFYCFARGIPDPVVTWYRNNQLLNGTDTTALHFKSNNQMLVINRVIKTDDGIYHCNATNRGGFAVRNLTLQVITGKTEETSGFQISTKHVIITACVLTAVLVTCMLYIFGSKIYKRKKRRRRLPFMNSAKFSQGHLELLNSDLPFEEQAELLPYDHCWEFPKDRLKLGITLGQGVFGRVVKAEAIGLIPAEPSSTVAVKLLKEQADINQQRALMTELKILSHLGHHVNIVNLLGAVTKNLHKGELMVLVEYCHHGNLRHYLLHNRENFINQINKATGEIDIDCNELPFLPSTSEDDEGNAVFNSIAVGVKPQSQRDRAASTSELLHYRTNSSNSDPPSRRSSIFTLPDTHPIDNKKENDNKDNITTCDLLSYSFQCARGMEYLASRKLLHRDLAARNVLLAEGNIIKICDFGLAKDLYEYGSYVKKGDGPLPIKWMAIESIRDKIFTTKSDVWSFGILLWEIYTLGRNPYPGIDLNEQFFKKLNDGYRMEKPEYSPSSVYNIMTSCWEAEPKSRPDFKILVNLLGTVLEESVRQHYVDFNNEHSEIANDDETDNCTCEMHEYVNVDRKHSPSLSSNEGSQRRIISNNYDKAQKKQNNSPSASLREGSLRKTTLRHYDSIQSLGRHSPSMSSNDGSQRIALRHYDSIQTVKRTPDGISLQVPTEVVPVISLESDKPNQLSPTNSQYMDIQNEQLLQEHSSNSHESSEHSSYYELSLENLSDSCANSSSVIS